TSYDQLSVSGAANVAGTIDVDLVNNFLPVVGEQFDVVLRGSGSGAFSSTISDDPGLTYTVNYQTDRVTVTITAVPEPSAMVLAATAAGLAMILRRRNRKQSAIAC
ncbi:MAG TPA: PEP-CTERM sorting domain-containing protein, partial [Pirellulales bacterium]